MSPLNALSLLASQKSERSTPTSVDTSFMLARFAQASLLIARARPSSISSPLSCAAFLRKLHVKKWTSFAVVAAWQSAAPCASASSRNSHDVRWFGRKPR